MKKVLALLLAVMMLASIGCAWAEETADEVKEITFQDIPWGSSTDDVKQYLVDSGICPSGKNIQVYEGDWAYQGRPLSMPLNETGVESGWDSIFTHYENIKYIELENSYTSQFQLQMGGYNIWRLAFLFLCDEGGTYLLSVTAYPEYDKGQGDKVFADLSAKLSTVYGAGQTGEDACIYLGANDTAIYLTQKGEFTGSTYLVYGRTDGLSMLEACFVEEEKDEVDSTDTSGL